MSEHILTFRLVAGKCHLGASVQWICRGQLIKFVLGSTQRIKLSRQIRLKNA
jgi:hypothetical protein